MISRIESMIVSNHGLNTVKVALPLIEDNIDLTADEKIVLDVLNKTKPMAISEIVNSPEITFGKSKVTEILKRLSQRDFVVIEGNGRGTKYRKANNLVVDNLFLRPDENNPDDRALIDSIRSLGWDDVLTD